MKSVQDNITNLGRLKYTSKETFEALAIVNSQRDIIINKLFSEEVTKSQVSQINNAARRD